MVVPKGAKHPEIAKKFIKYYLTSQGYMDILHSVPGHFYPSLRSVAESEVYLSHPLFKSHPDTFEVLKSSHTIGSAPHYESPGVPNPNMDNVINTGITQDVLQRVLIKGESPQKALDWGQKRIEEIMEEVAKTEG
jgi:multiple sugar transport system substrate-binding protein